MPTSLSWSLVLPLIVDGLLISVGWALGTAVINAIAGVIAGARRRTE